MSMRKYVVKTAPRGQCGHAQEQGPTGGGAQGPAHPTPSSSSAASASVEPHRILEVPETIECSVLEEVNLEAEGLMLVNIPGPEDDEPGPLPERPEDATGYKVLQDMLSGLAG